MHELLQLGVNAKASDLHFSPGLKPIFRIDGELTLMEECTTLTAEGIKNFIYEQLSTEQKTSLEQKRQLDFSLSLANVCSFRTNAFYQMHGLAAVLRITPSIIPTLAELKTPPILEKLTQLESGLILIAGPTGSGKSTTLAAMIHQINKLESKHIITIEDPIEYHHRSLKSIVNQRQIFRDAVSFKTALRAALREDPDIILVGEMRDLDSIRLALTAAETGHLVLTTLHTSTAPHAISRIIDVFPTGEKNIIRNQLAEALKAVVCQSLIKSIYGGRVAAFEIMLGTNAIRNLIREDKLAQMYSVLQTSSRIGMCTMDNAIAELIRQGVVSAETARLISFDRDSFE